MSKRSTTTTVLSVGLRGLEFSFIVFQKQCGTCTRNYSERTRTAEWAKLHLPSTADEADDSMGVDPDADQPSEDALNFEPYCEWWSAEDVPDFPATGT